MSDTSTIATVCKVQLDTIMRDSENAAQALIDAELKIATLQRELDAAKAVGKADVLTIEQLQQQVLALQSCAVSMQRWKLMAEYQYALRAYPDELALGSGALDATMLKWTGEEYQAVIDAWHAGQPAPDHFAGVGNMVSGPKPGEHKRVAPWPDFNGKPIHEGDTIRHPDGSVGTVVFLNIDHPTDDPWRIKYEDGITLRLNLQIGDKGRGVVSAKLNDAPKECEQPIERKLNQAAATGDVNHYIRAIESAREEFGDG